MADIHALTARIGPGGMSVTLTCPYTGAPLAGADPVARPLCRRADPTRCAAVDALADRGPGGVWIGPSEAVGAVALDTVEENGRLYLRSVEPGGLDIDPDEAAQALARLSGHPRYAGDGWRRLFEQAANVEHATREALRRGADKAVIGPLREQLRTWHSPHPLADMPEVGVRTTRPAVRSDGSTPATRRTP